mmetsp:Transcript_4958/g.14039  ORF Transcript_4958/g.14039 Transcript_4958/m.14039 type:complete len:217 (+) Transcript_4958:723-1373(+)
MIPPTPKRNVPATKDTPYAYALQRKASLVRWALRFRPTKNLSRLPRCRCGGPSVEALPCALGEARELGGREHLGGGPFLWLRRAGVHAAELELADGRLLAAVHAAADAAAVCGAEARAAARHLLAAVHLALAAAAVAHAEVGGALRRLAAALELAAPAAAVRRAEVGAAHGRLGAALRGAALAAAVRGAEVLVARPLGAAGVGAAAAAAVADAELG